MAALPTSVTFTGSSVTEGGFKAALTQLRDYLSGLLGADGVPVTARQALLIDKIGADIASASTIDLDAATGDFVSVTGTTTINAITLSPGVEKTVNFSGATTLVHSAGLLLPGSANIVTQSGDVAVFRGLSGATRCVAYSSYGSGVPGGAGTLAHRGLLDLSAAAAGQIKFPATQNPSADPNILDDYEEGTFTPGIAFGGASVGVTYASQAGSYTKCGNRVSVSGQIVLTNKGSSTGILTITGLPFATAENAVADARLTSLAITLTNGAQFVVSGSTLLAQFLNGLSAAAMDNTYCNNTTDIIFTATYRV